MPAVQRVILGKMQCHTPGCHNVVTVKEDANERAYYTCSECSGQHFSKGPRADKLFRIELAKMAAPPAAAPAPAAKPAAPAPAAKPAAPAPAAKPAAPAPAAKP